MIFPRPHQHCPDTSMETLSATPSPSLGFTVGKGVWAGKGQCHAWTSCKDHLSKEQTEEASSHISNTTTSETAEVAAQDTPHNFP